MVPPTGDGGSPAPIDRPILEFLQTRLQATRQVSRATVTDASGHLELQVVLAPSYYPAAVDEAQLTLRWYTNDDFKCHYREQHADHTWECLWDRHPNPHSELTLGSNHGASCFNDALCIHTLSLRRERRERSLHRR